MSQSARLQTGIPALDDLLGGGLLPGTLTVVLGATGTPSHTSVVRWQRGVAQYALGHRDRVRAAVTAARTHKIALAGADYYGPGVNDLCIDTARILDEVRAW